MSGSREVSREVSSVFLSQWLAHAYAARQWEMMLCECKCRSQGVTPSIKTQDQSRIGPQTSAVGRDPRLLLFGVLYTITSSPRAVPYIRVQ